MRTPIPWVLALLLSFFFFFNFLLGFRGQASTMWLELLVSSFVI